MEDISKILQPFPEYRKCHVENRYSLIKEFEKYWKEKGKGKNRSPRTNQCESMKEFCEISGLNLKTFYKYYLRYKKDGIYGLLTKLGHQKGKSKYTDTILPIARTIIGPGRGFKESHDELSAICKEKGIKIPSYATFIRMARAFSLMGDTISEPCGQNKKANTIRGAIEINLYKPLLCLQQIKEIIEYNPTASQHAKNISLRIMDYLLTFTDSSQQIYKQRSLRKPLTTEESSILDNFVKNPSRNYIDRATVILMANEKRSLFEMAARTGRSYKTINKWLVAYRRRGISFIKAKIDRKRNNPELKNRTENIIKILHRNPEDYGINRATWFLKDIAEAYQREFNKKMCITSIRRALKNTNYTWKRAKKVLTSTDPDYREKTQRVLNIMRNIDSKEAFLFIDEAGPYYVKKYGGKSLTQRDTIKTIPQYQKTKGHVSFIAALDAYKNHVIHLFITNKDTASVVRFIEFIQNKYQGYSRIYITWDGASWHKSNGLRQSLAELNQRKKPQIEIIPLPTRSQFLNVIESVFGGMKRAVIMNSNYNSELAMKAAITRHFRERNKYFKANPKRAGKQIWDAEYFSLDGFESGLHKKM